MNSVRAGVMSDLHFINDWEQYPLPLKNIHQVDFNKEWSENQPAFYHYNFEVDVLKDTYLDTSGFGKGVVFVNGFNVGRFWEKGPTLSLFIPRGVFNVGLSEIIIFETEGTYQSKISLREHPVHMDIESLEEK